MKRRDETAPVRRPPSAPSGRGALRAPASLERGVDELASPRSRGASRSVAAAPRRGNTLRQMLVATGGLGRALLLREVLGPPKGLE